MQIDYKRWLSLLFVVMCFAALAYSLLFSSRFEPLTFTLAVSLVTCGAVIIPLWILSLLSKRQFGLLFALLAGLAIGAIILATATIEGTEDAFAALILAFSIATAVTLTAWLICRWVGGYLLGKTTQRIVVGQLATVVRQHLPLSTGVALAAEAEKGLARTHLQRIAHLLAQGEPLSQAVRKGYRDCPSVALSLIIAGEKAGQLPAALDEAEHFLLERDRRRPPYEVSVWLYLLVIAGFTMLVVSGIMVAIVPKYKAIVKDYAAEMPAATQSLIAAWGYLASGGVVGLLVLPVILVLVYLSLRPRRVPQLAITSKVADWIRWHMPGFGRIEMGRGMQQVLRTMRLGVRSGMSLDQAAGLAELVDVNQQLRPRIRRFGELLREGAPVREAARRVDLGEVTGVALAAGQRAARMDVGLRYAADYHGAVAGRLWAVLRNLTWPVCTLIMGIVVGWVVLALFLPLISLIDSVSVF